MKNTEGKEYVVYKSLAQGNAFMCMADKNPNHEYDGNLADGTLAYEVIGFFNEAEAHAAIDKINGPFSLFDYISKNVEEMKTRAHARGINDFDKVDPEAIFSLCRRPGDLSRTA